jgi:tyrosinase
MSVTYYNLAIHGAPYVGWNGVQAPKENPKTNGGYCVHNEITFGTWHRPYLLLFEVSGYLFVVTAIHFDLIDMLVQYH